MWSYGAIEPSWLTQIASGDNANTKLWILWRHVKIKKIQIVYHKSYTLTKMSQIMQNSWKWWTRDQNIVSYEEIEFLGKICCFYQKGKWIFEKFWFLPHMV